MKEDTLKFHDLLLGKIFFIWDFDGCLCDSERVHFLAYRDAFAAYGHTIQESEYYHRFSHTGLGAAEEIKVYNLSCDIADIRQKKNAAYWERISRGEAGLFPEVPEILNSLERLGIQSIVASNSPQHELELILSQSPQPVKLHAVFGLVPGLRKKPAPDIFLYALEKLQISPEQAVVLEDSERGLLAAQAARIPALWVKTGFSENFSTHAPYVLRPTHAELLELLKTFSKEN